MKTVFLLLVFAFVTVFSHGHYELSRECGTTAEHGHEVRESMFLDQILNSTGSTYLRRSVGDSTIRDLAGRATDTYIQVYFHVINKGPLLEDGNVNDTMIANQISVLNSAFDGSGLIFVLNSVDRYTNSVWFNMTKGSQGELNAKQYLKKGTAASLNIYSCAPFPNVVGWGSFPWDYTSFPTLDGIVIHWATLPGGPALNYNLGNTAAHETGHWLGLYHTFEGGCCDGNSCGDYVSDTPAEATAAYGCPASRNTCASTGNDPINDYMDYTDDRCTWYFTYGQAVRMLNSWATYRNGK